jgi:hypothetical protein
MQDWAVSIGGWTFHCMAAEDNFPLALTRDIYIYICRNVSRAEWRNLYPNWMRIEEAMSLRMLRRAAVPGRRQAVDKCTLARWSIRAHVLDTRHPYSLPTRPSTRWNTVTCDRNRKTFPNWGSISATIWQAIPPTYSKICPSHIYTQPATSDEQYNVHVVTFLVELST